MKKGMKIALVLLLFCAVAAAAFCLGKNQSTGERTSDKKQKQQASLEETEEKKRQASSEVSEEKKKNTEQTLKKMVVIIDPGHQKNQNTEQEPIGPGAGEKKPKVSSGTSGTVSGLQEYELTLQISKKLKKELLERGYSVHMTRNTHDVNMSNAERAAYAKKAGGDIFVRIHANGSEDPSVRGALSMAPSKNNPYVAELSEKSQMLSRCILDEYCKATGMKNRGVMETDQMSGINWTSMPVTILEMGFMSNPKDDASMKDSNFQEKMVSGAADGIDRYVKEMETEEENAL